LTGKLHCIFVLFGILAHSGCEKRSRRRAYVLPLFIIYLLAISVRPTISTFTGIDLRRSCRKTLTVDERFEVSFSISEWILPWQPMLFGFIGFYPQNRVASHSADSGRRTSRSATDVLDASGDQL